MAVELKEDEQKNLLKSGAGVGEIVERLMGDGTDGADDRCEENDVQSRFGGV